MKEGDSPAKGEDSSAKEGDSLARWEDTELNR